MRILARRVGESLIFGKDFEVIILVARSNRVPIGIKAPEDVGIVQNELLNGNYAPRMGNLFRKTP